MTYIDVNILKTTVEDLRAEKIKTDYLLGAADDRINNIKSNIPSDDEEMAEIINDVSLSAENLKVYSVNLARLISACELALYRYSLLSKSLPDRFENEFRFGKRISLPQSVDLAELKNRMGDIIISGGTDDGKRDN